MYATFINVTKTLFWKVEAILAAQGIGDIFVCNLLNGILWRTDLYSDTKF
jgi:hypothetical protein